MYNPRYKGKNVSKIALSHMISLLKQSTVYSYEAKEQNKWRRTERSGHRRAGLQICLIITCAKDTM